MKILLIDIDSKLPNIALMKLSSFYKNKGYKIELCKLKEEVLPNNLKEYEKIFGSLIFTRSLSIIKKIEFAYPEIKFNWGGTGYSLKIELPKEIDICKSDYDLYNIDYGIGFSARGCIRNCEFCFVPKKEGKLKQYNELEKLLNPRSKKIILLDNNFTADKEFKNKAEWLIENDIVVDLCQGVDVRVLNDEKASLLSKIKHEKQLHIAWDLKKEEQFVLKGLELLTKYIKPYKIMCYVLIGFNTTLEYDLYRIEKLKQLKVTPYVMNYNTRQDGYYKHLARFTNAFLYRNNDFKDYEPYKKILETEKQQTLL